MSYILARALRSFEFEGQIKTRKSPPFPITRHRFLQLQTVGLVEEVEQSTPDTPGGKTSSASLPGPASPEQTVSSSDDGEQKAITTPRRASRRGASSSRTQRSK